MTDFIFGATCMKCHLRIPVRGYTDMLDGRCRCGDIMEPAELVAAFGYDSFHVLGIDETINDAADHMYQMMKEHNGRLLRNPAS